MLSYQKIDGCGEKVVWNQIKVRWIGEASCVAIGWSTIRVVVRSALSGVPEKPLGLYDPSFDKDSCGVGFVAELSGETSRKTVTDALEMLVRMTHRGACGCETNTGDGAGIFVAQRYSASL